MLAIVVAVDAAANSINSIINAELMRFSELSVYLSLQATLLLT